MKTYLLNLILIYKDGDSNQFIDVLKYFEISINFYSRKLNYYCAETDLIIFLLKLISKIDINKFNSDEELDYYIKKSIKREYIQLNKNNLKNSFILFNSEVTDIQLSSILNSKEDESSIVFQNLIDELPLRQGKIIRYRYELGLSDEEISKKLKVSRQTIFKERKKALNTMKCKLKITW